MGRKFSTADWAKGASVYEVNIRQYTQEGSFNAFALHLPRLAGMGVEVLWCMPITPISVKGRQGTLGSYYACSSYVQVNAEFGTLADFKQMVKTAHTLGMKVIIDWVANHTGCDHEWTVAHPEWYVRDAAGAFTERNGWKDVIDLDYTVQPMRDAMIDAMKYWIKETGIDGFRCDMAHLVPLDFWHDARTACEEADVLFWLAECEDVAYHQVFDTSYAWSWMHATEGFTSQQHSLQEVWNVLHTYSQYPSGSMKLFFTANHDENSWNGTEYEKYGGAARAWSVFCFTWAGMPLLYSGQESPNLARLPFFEKGLIAWNHPLQLGSFYQALLQLRRNPAVRNGETFILPTRQAGNQVMAFIRRSGDDAVLVLLNVSADSRIRIQVTHEWLNGGFRNLFSGLSYQFKGSADFELQAGEYFVYVRQS